MKSLEQLRFRSVRLNFCGGNVGYFGSLPVNKSHRQCVAAKHL